MTYSADFMQGPVARAELKHQSDVMENTRAGIVWIWLAYILLYPAIAISIGIFLGALLNYITPFTLIPGDQGLTILTAATTHLIGMNAALYMVVTLVTLGLAAQSITREKQGKTWDMLLLTGVDARQIIYGKWWATVRVMWKDHALLYLLRLGMIAWLVQVTNQEFFFRPGFLSIQPHMLFLILGAAQVALYSVLDAMLTAAIGQLIPLIDFNTGALAAAAFVGRVLLSFAPLVIPYLIFTTFENHEAGFYMVFWMGCNLLTALLTWGVLRLAQRLAVRERALPPMPN